jgi:hypothetical protein
MSQGERGVGKWSHRGGGVILAPSGRRKSGRPLKSPENRRLLDLVTARSFIGARSRCSTSAAGNVVETTEHGKQKPRGFASRRTGNPVKASSVAAAVRGRWDAVGDRRTAGQTGRALRSEEVDDDSVASCDQRFRDRARLRAVGTRL